MFRYDAACETKGFKRCSAIVCFHSVRPSSSLGILDGYYCVCVVHEVFRVWSLAEHTCIGFGYTSDSILFFSQMIGLLIDYT